jgi:hypothetical protein
MRQRIHFLTLLHSSTTTVAYSSAIRATNGCCSYELPTVAGLGVRWTSRHARRRSTEKRDLLRVALVWQHMVIATFGSGSVEPVGKSEANSELASSSARMLGRPGILQPHRWLPALRKEYFRSAFAIPSMELRWGATICDWPM